MASVAVIDYGMGNLRSVAQAVMAAAHGTDIKVVITADPQVVDAAERVVLPGQGAMRDCMRELHDSGLMPSVLHAAAHKPLFGVCGHANVATTAPKATRAVQPALGSSLARWSNLTWLVSTKPTAAASRCRKWAGTK